MKKFIASLTLLFLAWLAVQYLPLWVNLCGAAWTVGSLLIWGIIAGGCRNDPQEKEN